MISLVICTHNPNPSFLERALEPLQEIMAGRADCELIVVDNASSPAVHKLECVVRSGARVLREERLGLTAARERAAREVAGDIVLFIDDDNVLALDYVDRAAELFADPQVGMMSGHIEPEYLAPPPRWIKAFEALLALRTPIEGEPQFTSVPRYTSVFPVGAGCVVRACVLRRYFEHTAVDGRIEGRSGQALLSGEDTDLALFAISEGFLVGCSSKLRLIHIIPPSRVEPDYLIRISEGTIASCASINRKWKVRLGHDVFDFMEQSSARICMRMAVYSALAWYPPFRIRARMQLALHRTRFEST